MNFLSKAYKPWRKWIENYVKKITYMEDDGNHPWMRENLIKSDDMYACILNGRPVSLQEVLFGDASINTKQNIIVFAGEKHIGKKFVVKRLIEECKKSVRNEAISKNWTQNCNDYRIPIIIYRDWFNRLDEDITLEKMVTRVIEENCGQQLNKSDYECLESVVTELMALGRFFIYFEGTYWMLEKKGIPRLDNVLRNGRLIENYNRKARYHNLAILIVDSETDLEDSFLYENNHVVVKLNKLTEEEVKTYLEKNYPSLLSIKDFSDDIMKILQTPSNLKMFENLYGKSLIDEKTTIRNKFEFYSFYIRKNIENKLNETGRNISSSGRVNVIYKALGEYAAELYVNGVKANKDEIKSSPSRYFSFGMFHEIGILDVNGEFTFPLCGYFLAAENFLNKMQNGRIKQIPNRLLEMPLEKILLWVSELIESVDEFDTFWKLLIKDNRCKLLLLARIVSKSNFGEVFMPLLYERAFSCLSAEFYDYTVLEAFNELGESGASYLKIRYDELEGNTKEINNIRKRCVYFLGISHNGITCKMLNELVKDDTDLHLKYHIIRAAVENYNENEGSSQLIEQHFETLKERCGMSTDPIIMSDFCVLYKACKKEEWLARQEQHNVYGKLKELLNSDIYWIRAHAAGAVGRSSMQNVNNLLIKRIEEELQMIYDKRDDYKNSIKVISYSVESICELCDRNKNSTNERDIISKFLRFLNMEKLGDRNIEDAYATIATGIEHLLSGGNERPAFNLGDRFRNHTNHLQVLHYAFVPLIDYFEGDFNEIHIISEKIRSLKEIMTAAEEEMERDKKKAKIKILQLSDCHFTGKNANNNRIIAQLKKYFKDVDILVITGDLRQIGTDYTETLSILRNLISNLGLTPKDIFMVPGNHDCLKYNDSNSEEAKMQKKNFDEIRKGIFDDKEDYMSYLPELYQNLKEYKAFLYEFYGDELLEQGGLHNRMLTWKNKLHILTMNTALLCDENSDKKKIVNLEELSEIELEEEDKIPVVCISHHKLDQLYLEHEKMIKSIYKDLKVSALLSGDIHQSMVGKIYLNPYAIPNYVCGKFLSSSCDNWSDQNIAVYELDLDKKELVPSLYKLEDGKLVPDFQFKKAPESGNPQDEWTKEITKLL